MEHPANHILLRGNVHSAPQLSHENHGHTYYRFYLTVPRLSGTSDILPVIAEKCLVDTTEVTQGCMLTVTGQIRSHNIRTDGRRHLLLFVFAATLLCEDGEPLNSVVLRGPVCRDPIFRRTPLGREICDLMLAVPRSFHRADYIPCILWGKNARTASSLHINDSILIEGRFQSREYTKITESGTETRTAYEVSVLSSELYPKIDGENQALGNSE